MLYVTLYVTFTSTSRSTSVPRDIALIYSFVSGLCYATILKNQVIAKKFRIYSEFCGKFSKFAGESGDYQIRWYPSRYLS